jgi:hypothetical protein
MNVCKGHYPQCPLSSLSIQPGARTHNSKIPTRRSALRGPSSSVASTLQRPPPKQAGQPPTTETSTTPGAGVRGAARGGIVGGIVEDAGAGAVAGAVAGCARSRRQNATTEQLQQAATSQPQAGKEAVQKADRLALKGVATR